VTRRRFYLAVFFLLWISLGCNLPAGNLTTPTPTATYLPPPVVEESLPTPTDTETPDIPPTITTEPTLTPAVEVQPGFPVGFTTTSEDGATLRFHDLSGQILETIYAPELSAGQGKYLHVAGPFVGTTQDLPIIFQTYAEDGYLKQSLNGQVTPIVQVPNLSYLQGVPGQHAYVYATVVWSGEALTTYFYVRSAYGGGASWIWDRVDPESWVMTPLAVAGENNELQTIFYTLEPWGIGGDIVFPPRKGLFQLNLEYLENVLLLTEDFNPIGLSPDNTHVAYTEANNNLGVEKNARITLYNLISGLMVPVDLAPGSDRGGGYAVFSPDNLYAAWMEGAGWMMAETPNFHSRVRIANLDGAILADIPDTTFAGVAGDLTARWAIPSGWLDGEYLLVEVRGDNWNNPALVKVRYDGSDMTYLTSGSFLGFQYP
jgi:hypothetical protein